MNSNSAVYAPPANRPPTVSIVEPGNAYSGPDSYWTSLNDAHTGPFQAAYSDPDGDTGTVGCTLFRYDELQGWLTDQSATVNNVASGSTPSCSFPLAIETGDWAWTAWANDGHNTAVSTPPHYFHVNWRPNKPTLESPKVAGGGTVDVPTTTPVLSATGSDHEADTLGYRFFVSTTDATNCPLPGATVDSGYLGATDTFTVPSGALKDGCTYSWSVRTTDFWDRDDDTSSESPQSDSGLFRVRVPELGLRDYWPMWSRGPVAVNEATGNLVLAVPGPSYPTAAGSLGASLAYNLLDTRVSAFPSPAGSWTLGLADVPARLIDHDLLPINSPDRFDAVEVVEADGSSTYYTRVGNSDTYQSPPGDTSVLARRPAGGFLLTGPDGSSYDFGAGDSNNGGIAPLVSATVSSNLGQTKLTYAFAGGKVQSVNASGKDGSGNYQTLGALQFKWAGDPACTDALLCIIGPDNVRWRYVGEGPSGTSGKLATVSDGVRNVLQIGYDAINRPSTLRNANDLDPSNASPGYSAAHQLQIGYDASGRVANVVETQVRNRFFNVTGGTEPFTRRDLVWAFAFSCAGAVLHAPTQSHSPVQSASAGCTELTLPKGQKTQVFYDRLAHPLESRDPLGNYTLTQYDDRDQLAWSEDPLHNPTDYAYDAFSFLPTSVTGPDPDTPAGLLPRTLTGYFYDETKPGDGNSAGAALQGLQASYFDTPDLTGAQGGTPVNQRNDPNVDSVANWGGGGPPALGGRTTNFSVRWTGILNVAAQTSKVFATVADGGTRLTIDGTVAIDKWTGQTTAQPSCSGQPIPLTAGKHRIMLEYRETTGTPSVQLQWGAACTSLTIVAPSDLQPGWFNQTSTVGYGTGNGDTKRVGFSHFASPETRRSDYSLADATGARLITSFGYDGYGRITSKVMPKGNSARSITAGGDLTGAVTPGFDTTYTYYPAGAQASSGACGTPSANQAGLPQTTAASGLAPVTNVYDAAGRPVATTNGAGTSCRTYDSEGRLIAEKAPGESQQTTYAYDPAGLLRTSTDAGGTVTNVYDESGAIIDVTDSYGAESELAHDADGNVTLRRVAVGPLAASTVYTTTNSFDTADRLIRTDDPAARRFTFSYDARGALKGTQYPNGTFSWNNYVPTGWLAGTYNQHGTAPAPTGTPPSDANALSDFVYYYFADGRRSRETRTGGTFADEVTSYAYDGVGRLALVWGALSRTYCYDLDSNRTALYLAVATCGLGTPDASYSYPPGQGVDQLQSVVKSGATTAYTYKSDGQVSARGGDTFTWDGRGRLTGGTYPSFNGTQFLVDGNSVGGPVAGGSPTRQLDTTTLANGWHTIGATAADRNGKQGAAPSRVINVQNGGQPASQIQFVKQLGPATTTAAVSTVTLAVPATGVAAGRDPDRVRGKAGTKVTAVSDSKANTYAADRSSISNGATNVAVYSGRVTLPLTSTDSITVKFGSATANPAVALPSSSRVSPRRRARPTRSGPARAARARRS